MDAETSKVCTCHGAVKTESNHVISPDLPLLPIKTEPVEEEEEFGSGHPMEEDIPVMKTEPLWEEEEGHHNSEESGQCMEEDLPVKTEIDVDGKSEHTDTHLSQLPIKTEPLAGEQDLSCARLSHQEDSRLHSDPNIDVKTEPMTTESIPPHPTNPDLAQTETIVENKPGAIPTLVLGPSLPYTCGCCGFATKVLGTLKTHMLIHTDEKPFKCNQCSYASRTKSGLKKHEASHSDLRPYVCNVCGHTSKTKPALKQHQLKHATDQVYPCPVCGKKYRSVYSLRDHAQIHDKDASYPCDYCGKSFKCHTALRKHLKIHTSAKDKLVSKQGSKLYSCTLCGDDDPATFTSSSYLTNHYIDDHSVKMGCPTRLHQLFCPLCEFTVDRRVLLRQHILKEHLQPHGARLHVCVLCNYSTLRKAELQTHMYRHSGEKPLCCSLCDYSTCFPSVMKKHMLAHLASAFPCNLCAHVAQTPEALTQHQQYWHCASPDSKKNSPSFLNQVVSLEQEVK